MEKIYPQESRQIFQIFLNIHQNWSTKKIHKTSSSNYSGQILYKILNLNCSAILGPGFPY